MEFTQKEFLPVVFGNDINVYSVARAFYEEYKVKSRVFGKALMGANEGDEATVEAPVGAIVYRIVKIER